jgi:hypothetical protein
VNIEHETNELMRDIWGLLRGTPCVDESALRAVEQKLRDLLQRWGAEGRDPAGDSELRKGVIRILDLQADDPWGWGNDGILRALARQLRKPLPPEVDDPRPMFGWRFLSQESAQVIAQNLTAAGYEVFLTGRRRIDTTAGGSFGV